ncbi:MAG: IclR family transcriptional regulator [Thermomicrobiales bacterium]
MREGSGLRTLERGLAVLELLGAADGGYQVSEVAQRLSLPMGTTHRLLQTLLHAGYVEQDPRTRRYQLGLKILELRGATVGAMRIAAEARPLLRDLMLRTDLRVHLAVYRGGGVVYIDRVDNSTSLTQYVPLGRRASAHATGLGKAILAHSTEEEVGAFLARQALTEFTSRTITDAGELRQALAATRQRGFAVDRGESHDDTRCVAAPIFDYTGRAVAAVSVAGTPAEVEPRVSELGQVVMGIARDISRRFGYRPAEELAYPDRDVVAAWGREPGAVPRGAGDEG